MTKNAAQKVYDLRSIPPSVAMRPLETESVGPMADCVQDQTQMLEEETKLLLMEPHLLEVVRPLFVHVLGLRPPSTGYRTPNVAGHGWSDG